MSDLDIELIRKIAADEVGRRAVDELTAVDTALDDVLLHKAAQAEDPDLFRIAMRMEGDPFDAYEFLGGKYKIAADMPPFLEQDRPKKVKEIYSALKRDHPDMPAETKARIAARQGKKGHQKQGPPYKGPITKKAFGQPLFQAQSAPDPRAQLSGLKPPTPSASGPKPPSIGSQGGSAGGGAGSGMTNPVSIPSIPGATS